MSVDPNALAKLKQACDQAYDMHPGSCSHAVWHVIKQYLPQQPWMDANALMAHIKGQSYWKKVQVPDLGRLVREGNVIVGGKTETDTNGHVIVVYPGPDQQAGGYSYNRNGKKETVKARGSYALAMSTSLGGWVGAKSKGDKTIWDPWANEVKFAQVTFWQLDMSAVPPALLTPPAAAASAPAKPKPKK